MIKPRRDCKQSSHVCGSTHNIRTIVTLKPCRDIRLSLQAASGRASHFSSDAEQPLTGPQRPRAGLCSARMRRAHPGTGSRPRGRSSRSTQTPGSPAPPPALLPAPRPAPALRAASQVSWNFASRDARGGAAPRPPPAANGRSGGRGGRQSAADGQFPGPDRPSPPGAGGGDKRPRRRRAALRPLRDAPARSSAAR